MNKYQTHIAKTLENVLYYELSKKESISLPEIEELELFGAMLMAAKLWCERPDIICPNGQGQVDSNAESADSE